MDLTPAQMVMGAAAVVVAPVVAFKVVKWIVKKMIYAVIFAVLSLAATAYFLFEKFSG
jgi:hypothetical protein